ncbi:uncharacterized protein LOC141856562 isoform X1 [Brevipalpus obovatus]|uniref:uncharacterized protein LOC141856562 isoform X1 n=1 Tax=Brevipalpus obovatus TaxID=246614 RepID=UPI003D9F0603
MGSITSTTMTWSSLFLIVLCLNGAIGDVQQQKIDQVEQTKDSGYSVASSYGQSSGSNDDIQTAAQYQQSAYAGNGPSHGSVGGYSYNQQIQHQQPVQQHQPNFQPIIGYASQSQQGGYDQQSAKLDDYGQQQGPSLNPSQNGYQGGGGGEYGISSNVKSNLGPKKTVILAIPVKLALQEAEKPGYGGSDADKQQQNAAYLPSNSYIGNGDFSKNRPSEQGQAKSYGNGDDSPKNDYRSSSQGYDNRPSFISSNYGQDSYSQNGPSPAYERSKDEGNYKNGGSGSGGNGGDYSSGNQYGYGSGGSNNNNNNNKDNGYGKGSLSYQGKPGGYEPANYVDNGKNQEKYNGYDNDHGDEGKGSYGYKSGYSKDDSPSTSYGDHDDDSSPDYTISEKSKSGGYGSGKYSESESSEYGNGNGKNKYKFGKGDSYPTLSGGGYDGDQDEWQSGYSALSGKGQKYQIEGGTSFSGGDDDDDDSYKPDTESVKAALSNYGSLKDIKIEDYSALLGGKGDMKDYGASIKDLSSLKEYASSLKEKVHPKKLGSYQSHDSDSIEEDYDASTSSLGTFSPSESAGVSGLSSYEGDLSSISGGSYGKGISMKPLKSLPSGYGGSSGLSMGESSFEGYPMGSLGSVHGAGPSMSSLTESYEGSPIGSHFMTSSGFNYGSASTLGGTPGISFKGPSLSPSYTISEGIMSDSIPSVSYGSNIQIPSTTHHSSMPNIPSNIQSYSQPNGSPLSVSGGDNIYGPNSPLDLSSLYGSMMRPSLGPMMPMRHGPYHSGPSNHGPNFASHPPINTLYGKPNSHQKQQQQQSKYGLRFPLYRPSSALSLYKGSSVSAPSKLRTSLLSSLYSSGSSPVKFYLKGSNGKGSSIFGSGLRLASSSSSKKPSSSFTSPFRYTSAIDNLFGQIYKLL